jgi:hypothetical protein
VIAETPATTTPGVSGIAGLDASQPHWTLLAGT